MKSFTKVSLWDWGWNISTFGLKSTYNLNSVCYCFIPSVVLCFIFNVIGDVLTKENYNIYIGYMDLDYFGFF